MVTIQSECGNYTIMHRQDGTGMAHIYEYSGFAPKLTIREIAVPVELLSIVMGTLTPAAVAA